MVTAVCTTLLLKITEHMKDSYGSGDPGYCTDYAQQDTTYESSQQKSSCKKIFFNEAPIKIICGKL